MSDNTETSDLHLPSLSIRGFRGINRLEIEHLGRVTLLAGRNGVGKTTVLDAVELFASRGDPRLMLDVVLRREEVNSLLDDDEGLQEDPNYRALFHGRQPELNENFSVGPADGDLILNVMYVLPFRPREWQQTLQPGSLRGSWIPTGPEFKISSGESEMRQPLFGAILGEGPVARERPWPMTSLADDTSWPAQLPCVLLGAGLPDNVGLAARWDQIALTPNESLARNALQLACHTEIEGIAPIGRPQRSAGRRMLVKPVQGERVPLPSMGDGAVRLLDVALALTDAAGGVLLIDEAENGLHHTLQHEYWGLVFRAAREFDVQVLATTHSWDCVAGFARAAVDDEESEGIAVRLEADDDDGGVRAIEYNERTLKVAAEQGIEVR